MASIESKPVAHTSASAPSRGASPRQARPRLGATSAALASWTVAVLLFAGCNGPSQPPPPAVATAPAAPATAPAAEAPSAAPAVVQAPALEPAAVDALAAGAGFGAATPSAAVGGLKVQWILPDTQVAVHAVGSIGFDRPMVPLAQVEDDAKVDWLEVEPAVPLRLRWLDPQTLSVAPRTTWPTASELSLRVRAGAKALDGAALEAPVSTTFRTPELFVLNQWPVGGPVVTSTGVAVLFSLPVTKAAVERALRVTSDATLPAITIDVPTDEKSLRRALVAASVSLGEELRSIVGQVAVLRFAGPLPRATEVVATVQAGLLPASGSRGLSEAKTWKFQTHGDFVASGLGCDGSCDPEEWQPIHLDFSNPLPEEDSDKSFAEFFEIKPSIDKIHVTCWSSRCAIGGRLKPDTAYEVTLKPGMVDAFGQKLAQLVGRPLARSIGLADEAVVEQAAQTAKRQA